MSLGSWLKQFREYHDKAKQGLLGSRELAQYRAARDELARALLAAQRLATPAGVAPRRALRVARALQADVEFHDGTVRAMTLDVGAFGFGALIAKPPKVNDEAKVTVRIPGGEPLRAEVRVVEVKLQPGTSRVGFAFVGLDEEAIERLETFVFDAALAELKG